MIKRSAIIASALLLALIFGVFTGDSGATAGDGKPVRLTAAHVYAGKGDEQEGLLWMAAQLAERSGGAITMKVYGDGTMGSEAEINNQVAAGVLDISISEGSGWVGIVNCPGLGVFGLPYLYMSYRELKAANQRVIAEEFNKLCEKNGVNLVALTAFSGGLRNMYTVREVVDETGLKGLKMRVPEIKLFIDTVQAAGCNATPTAWSDVYTSLSQGVVEGCEIDPVTAVDANLQEVVKYYIKTYHFGSHNIMCVNKEKWDSISPEYQILIAEVAKEAADRQYDAREARIGDAEAVLAAAGVKTVTLSPQGLTNMKKAVQPIWDEYKNDYGVGDVIDTILEVTSEP